MSDSSVRPPAVAGTFYPSQPAKLRRMVQDYLDNVAATPEPVRAVLAPHAGLVYSGQCAAHVFRRSRIPNVVVILGPNHTGAGVSGKASLWDRGAFETPLGTLSIAESLADDLMTRSPLIVPDQSAHYREHAIEVELPFIQVIAPETTIIPMVLSFEDWSYCEAIANAIAAVVRDSAADILLVASSDMTHYEPAERAAEKDKLALAEVETLDGRHLLETCRKYRVTMCGSAPAATILETARQLGAEKATVVDYRHSGWVTGDDASVVAYAGALVH